VTGRRQEIKKNAHRAGFSEGMVISGADLAIVDLNSESHPPFLNPFEDERSHIEKYRLQKKKQPAKQSP
jgi:hypothetical protein